MATVVICDRCGGQPARRFEAGDKPADVCLECAIAILSEVDGPVIAAIFERQWARYPGGYMAATKRADPLLAPKNGTTPAAPSQAPEQLSPLAARLDELREQHGPVFVLDTTAEYAPDQIVTWHKGKEPKQVQILERTPEQPARWFGKLVDQ